MVEFSCNYAVWFLAFCPGTSSRKEHFLELAKMAQQAKVCAAKPDKPEFNPWKEATWRKERGDCQPSVL